MGTWHRFDLAKHYGDVLYEAKYRGYSEKELVNNSLNKLLKRTGSERTKRMLTLAYYLGQMHAIRDINADIGKGNER